MADKVYIAIDLKSFYASVECADRGFDPLTTHLVVADETRTSKTICLAVTPSLKAYGISGRANHPFVFYTSNIFGRLCDILRTHQEPYSSAAFSLPEPLKIVP